MSKPSYAFHPKTEAGMAYHLYRQAEYSVTFHIDDEHRSVVITIARETDGNPPRVSACRVSFEELQALASAAAAVPAPTGKGFATGPDLLAGVPVVVLYPASDRVPVPVLCFSDEAWCEAGVYRGPFLQAAEVRHLAAGEDMRTMAKRLHG